VTLLGEVLARLPSLPLADAAVRHYVEFFLDKYEASIPLSRTFTVTPS
jgi:hypothetical protein